MDVNVMYNKIKAMIPKHMLYEQPVFKRNPVADLCGSQEPGQEVTDKGIMCFLDNDNKLFAFRISYNSENSYCTLYVGSSEITSANNIEFDEFIINVVTNLIEKNICFT